MRLLPVLFTLPFLALQAHAQPAPAVPAPATSAATASGPTAAVAQVASKPRRMSWQERFAQANTTHDGHLTLQQAASGYKTIARHFKEIDADKKGYVTVEDIDTWHKLQRAMRHSHQGPTVQPRPTLQQGVVQPRQINTTSVVPAK
ncbi:MAG TPA: hypothetical protein VMB34_31960 [Acetobacteraceae bacterium]|nr:hypothetical protein [Acetobacteraceae bacterium]